MSGAVERIRLAPGLEVSRVLTGLWQIADMERGSGVVEREAAARAMQTHAAAGFTSFDMADHYGSAEEIAGEYGARRSSPPIERLTKWVPKPGALTRVDVQAAVARALARLQAERLDLLQFHAWSYADPAWLDALLWLDELRREGLVGHLGLTNFDTAHLRIVLASGIPVVSNQVSVSLLDRRALGPMSALCRERGVKLLAYGTVAGGLLTERWLGRPEPAEAALSTWSEMKYARFVREAGGWAAFQDLLKVVSAVAQRRSVSMANVACRYVLEQEAVGGVIVGARLGQSEHIADNLRLFGFRLEPAELAELDRAADRLRAIPGDCGDEYRRPPFLTASGDLRHHLDSLPAPYPVITGRDGRSRVLTGTTWETLAGFSRAVRRGDHIFVSGTTATHRDRAVGGGDPAAQAHFVLDKIEGALQSLGSSLEDVVRTRVYVRNLADWEPVARAHGERLRHVQPANTLVQAGLVGDEYLVEMEAEALVG
jgi:aryl-alcohol dehydrogenase-like predicted oxidoreductase/enamine deaminase RidA (YjgF/YER057c/UK114 family)